MGKQFIIKLLFEVVISQVFRRKLFEPPSVIFSRLLKRNPSPYGFLMNLDHNEYLVGASPEMFVRVESNPKGNIKLNKTNHITESHNYLL